MSISPKLSIITINLNNRVGLEKTLASVKEQTWRDFEIHVLDGGSTDGSVEVIQRYAGLLTSWVSERDGGIYPAQNRGIRKANGEYLLFLNSGDWLRQPNSLELIFSQSPTADLLYGDVYFWKKGEPEYRKENQEELSALFLLLDTICHQVQILRRSLFDELGLYREDLRVVADYEFLVKALIQHRKTFQYYPVPLANVDLDGDGYRPEMADHVWKSRQAIQNTYWDSLTLKDLLTIPTLQHEIKLLRIEQERLTKELIECHAKLTEALKPQKPKRGWWWQ
jgi:glycosyltransferase involved in cell wall biosynthesis